MELTNKHDLPQPLVAAVSKDHYRGGGNISATGLISSPRQRVLGKRHYYQISEDVLDRIWAFLGTLMHNAIESATNIVDNLPERRLFTDVLGWKVSGQPDNLKLDDGILDDYKMTGAFKIIQGDYKDWTRQLNIYAWLLRKHGFTVNGIRIVAVIRDWSKYKAMNQSDYPKEHVVKIPLVLYPDEAVETWVKERVQMHQQAEFVGDDDLPDCTPEDRWVRDQAWALMKRGRKSAVRVFDTPEAADKAIVAAEAAKPKDKFFIEYRAGKSTRCESFCRVAPWCNQWAALRDAEKPSELVAGEAVKDEQAQVVHSR